VEILLELSRNGVQIFIATHSELLADYFLVNRKKGDEVMFFSLYKEDDRMTRTSTSRSPRTWPQTVQSSDLCEAENPPITRGYKRVFCLCPFE
jgi:hypothetical protein